MQDIPITGEELARYSRQVILPGIGRDGQEKLKAAHVLLIGSGGLGSPAALYLAAAGVGTLGLCDFDEVEAHNLQRQIIHSQDTVGKSKLTSAQARLKALNPYVNIHEHPEKIDASNALDLLEQYDLVIDGSDNFPTRYLVSDAAYLAKKPLVYGAVFQFEGQVSVFNPAHTGPSYRCLFPQMPEPGSVPNCAEAGVFGALCGVIGSFQAMEAIKLITGAGETLIGRLLVVDALTMRVSTIKLKRDPHSPLIGDKPTITSLDPKNYEWTSCTINDTTADSIMNEQDAPLEIDTTEAAKLFAQGTHLLLDVREPVEWDICAIDGSTKISMSHIPEQLDTLPRDKPILVMCHHGGRSMKITQYLRSEGYPLATNVAGGIHAWANKIDPSLARY